MTFISRVLGLVRDMVVANLMGAGAAADVFFFANKIPNFLRRLFAEGAFAQAFVPVLSEIHSEGDKDKLRLFIARAAGTLGTLVTLVTIIGVIGSPVLAAMFGTGWFMAFLNDEPDGSKFELASLMLKITFPYLWFITLTALSGAVLNTLNKFAVAAFTPVLLNIAIILCALYLSPELQEPAIGLAVGVFIGGIVQLLFQLPFLLRANVLVKPLWGWSDPQVAKVRKLMIPALFGVSVSQINLLLDTFIASFLVTGSISWLYYSDRLLEFPLGLFGIAIATVILPTLSRSYVKQDVNEFQHSMDWAFKMVCLLGIPAAAGLIILAKPMLLVLFQRGAFTGQDVLMASYSLVAYACGLLNFMLIKVLAPGFFSRQDTRTPVKYGIWSMAANMVFNIIFAIPFGYVGLAMATALSAGLNAILLYQKLHRTQVFRVSGNTLFLVARVVIAALAMSGVIYLLQSDFELWLEWEIEQRILELLLLLVAGVGSFVVALFAVGFRFHHISQSSR